jgi:hypothetical protein
MEGERLIGGTTNMRGPATEKEREREREQELTGGSP